MQRENYATEWILGMLMRGLAGLMLVYWPAYAINPDASALVLRPILLFIALLMAFLTVGMPLSVAEFSMLKVFGLISLVTLLTSVTAEDPETALMNWVKFVLIQLIAFLCARAFRSQSTSRVFGRWMLIAGIGMSLYTVYAYIHLMGITLPTYTAVRDLKGIAEKQNIPLNTIPACSIMCYICAICVLRLNKGLIAIGCFVVLVGSMLTGSRAALAITVAAIGLTLLCYWIKSRNLVLNVAAWSALVVGTLAVVTWLSLASSRVITSVTEGRWDLWRAAMSKFVERPILGYGFLSWKDDLVSRLPGEYNLTHDLAEHIAGGYHNEYVTSLAEHGVVGFAALLALYGFLVAAGWKLAFRRSYTWACGGAALFGALFLALRANVEMPGLFGYAQEPADYVAYIFLAFVVSRFSLEEDTVRVYQAAVTQQRFAWARMNRSRKQFPALAQAEPAMGED